MFIYGIPLFEAQIYDYERNPESNKNEIVYNFYVGNLYYSVFFDKSKNPPNSYHVIFSFTRDGKESENPFSERANLSLSHLLSVIDTVVDIAKKVASEYRPDIIAFSGDDDDSDIETQTRRSKIYQRYLSQRFSPDMYKIVSDNEVYMYVNKII